MYECICEFFRLASLALICACSHQAVQWCIIIAYRCCSQPHSRLTYLKNCTHARLQVIKLPEKKNCHGADVQLLRWTGRFDWALQWHQNSPAKKAQTGTRACPSCLLARHSRRRFPMRHLLPPPPPPLAFNFSPNRHYSFRCEMDTHFAMCSQSKLN